MKASLEQTKKLVESVQASAEQTKKLAASIDDMQSKDHGEDSTAGNRPKKTNGHRNSYKPKHTAHRITFAAFRAHADRHSPNRPPHNQKHPLFKLMANLAVNTKLPLFIFNVIKGSHVGNKLQVFMILFIGPSSFKKTMTIEMEGFPQGERPPRKRMRSQEAVVKGEKGTNRLKFNIDQQEEANTVMNQLTHAFILSHRRHMGDFHETYNSASHNIPHEEEKFQGIMGRNIIAGKMRKFSKALTNSTHLHLHVMLIMLSMHVMPLTTGFELNWLFNGPGRKMKTITCRTLRTRNSFTPCSQFSKTVFVNK
jgi:hypothetical protein